MIIRNIFIFIFFVSFLHAETEFNLRQKELINVRNMVQHEESISRAYEEYIINNYKFPTISELESTIGNVDISILGITKIPTLTAGLTVLSYALDNTILDSEIIELYKSNSLRKRTYFLKSDAKIHFILEDPFAKHLYDLLKNTSLGISTCPLFTLSILTPITCIKDNHLYIKMTNKLTNGALKLDFLMNYHIDKFKTGPIIITSDTSLHTTEDEFNSIPKGAVLYDINGSKYIKTTTSIEILK